MKLYIGNTQTMDYNRLYASASPERKEKADRLRREKDRRLCIAAGALAQRALAEAGCTLELAQDANGKPYFPGNPALHISFSHSGERALCALGKNPVGCDVEQVRPVMRSMYRRCLTDDEYAALSALPLSAWADRFIRLWVLKESLMKATGRGLRLDPADISLDLTDGVHLCTPDVACVFHEPEPELEYRYALCSLNPLMPPPMISYVGFSGADPW